MIRQPGAWLSVLVLTGSLTGCGRSNELSVDDLQNHPTFNTPADLGHILTVTGYLTSAPDGHSLRLSAARNNPEVNVLVLTTDTTNFTAGQQVRVTGKLGQLKTSFASEGAPYSQDHLYDWWETQDYLYDATVSST